MMLQHSRAVLFFLVSVLSILLLTSAIKIQIDSYNMKKYTEQAAIEAALLAKKTLRSANVEHIRCLAANIYHEAGSEPFMGQVAVARVVMNRIKHGFASNPCRVVYQSTTIPDLDNPSGLKKLCQFSWVCEGKSTPSRNAAYLQAEEIAKKVLTENKWHNVVPSNILFFHNKSVNPEWNYHPVLTIGNHVFYAKSKQNH